MTVDGSHVALLGIASEAIGCLRGMAEALEISGEERLSATIMGMYNSYSERLDAAVDSMLAANDEEGA